MSGASFVKADLLGNRLPVVSSIGAVMRHRDAPLPLLPQTHPGNPMLIPQRMGTCGRILRQPRRGDNCSCPTYSIDTQFDNLTRLLPSQVKIETRTSSVIFEKNHPTLALKLCCY